MPGNFPGTPANPVKVQTTLFDRALRSSEYWVGLSGQGGKAVNENLEGAACRLVADAYINEQQIFAEKDRARLLGEEPDPTMQSAQRFVALRRHDTEGWAELFATGAAVVNYGLSSGHLPIEDIFEDIFRDPSYDTSGCVEISRLTSRYPANKFVSHAGLICMMRCVFEVALEVEAPYIYAATERFVLGAIKSFGLPMETLGQPKEVQEARATTTSLIPVRFDVPAISEMRSTEGSLVQFYLDDLEYHHGLGFFDENLLDPGDEEHIVEPVYPLPLYPDL